LQEATDLAKRVKPYPVSQINSLANAWRQVNRSKAQGIIDSFIQDLRSEAADATDFNTYQQATSNAMSLMQSSGDADYEKMQEMIRNWPETPGFWRRDCSELPEQPGSQHPAKSNIESGKHQS